MGKAFSTEGNATVGTGDAPWQHKMLYPMNDRMMKEIRDYIADKGKFQFNPFLKMMMSWVVLDNGDVVARIGRLDYFFFFIILKAEEMFIYDNDIDMAISALVKGRFGPITKEKNKFPLLMVGSGGQTHYIFSPDHTPSIYSTTWRKYMFNFYIKYVNPDWMKDSYAAQRGEDWEDLSMTP
jgi:poly(3-hydroxyalkanoate) synthetase